MRIMMIKVLQSNVLLTSEVEVVTLLVEVEDEVAWKWQNVKFDGTQ
jgi:hypothetical protein